MRTPYLDLRNIMQRERARTESIKYKYNEDWALEEVKAYIDNTYDQHYSQHKFQTTEFIIDSGHGVGFCIGNIMKYAQRYGKKGGCDRTDIMKIIHYAIFLLYTHDSQLKELPHED